METDAEVTSGMASAWSEWTHFPEHNVLRAGEALVDRFAVERRLT